ISLIPPDPEAEPAAVAALGAADQIVIGPGSLYTSVIAACCVPAIREAVASASAQRVYVVNLREQQPETAGYGVEDHIAALARHGIEADVYVADTEALPVGSSDPRIRTARVGCAGM